MQQPAVTAEIAKPRPARTAAIVVSLAAPVVLFVLTMRNALDIPIGDEWAWVLLLYAEHTRGLQFADIWAQHNEHRIVFPAYLMLALEHFGGYDVVREIAANVAIAVTTLSVFVALIRRTCPAAIAPLAFMLVSLFTFSMAQYENWIWGFQMAWFLVNLCAVGAMLLLGAAAPSPLTLAAAALCAIVASFSVSSGLDIWIAGAFVLACRRPLRARSLVIWLAAAVVCFALYLHGYVKPAAHPSTSAFASDPAGFAAYLLTYLGAPLAVSRTWWGVLPAGLCICAAFVVAAVLAFRARPTDAHRTNAALPWLGLCVFAGLAAGMTAIGRFGFGIDQAFSSRYVTVSSLFWIGTLGAMCALDLPLRRLPHRAAAAAAVIAALIVGGSYLKAYQTGLMLERTDKDHRLLAYIALKNLATADDMSLTYAFPDPNAIRSWGVLLQNIHEGPFRR